MHLLFLWNVFALLALVPSRTLASVLAIDYGTDWIKASLMKPGVPFDVLLNKDSKRKIQSSVAWKSKDRLFGSDAFNLASRFPSDSFSAMKLLQAAPFDSDTASYYSSISTADLVETSRKTIGLKLSDQTEWSNEELVAMQLAYVKHLAEATAHELISDVIVTVPPYYSQFERDALADAVEIAGLRLLALINDGTAVAVNYAMSRTFSAPEYHVIYDAGSSSIRATVVAFDSVKDKKNGDGTSINVSGVGYDKTTGGIEMDRRLRELLINDFNTKHQKDIRESKRGLAKLWKEAGRVKTILSANSEAFATVESLAWDIDFRTKVTRASLEEACEDLKPKYAQPIQDALDHAGLTLANITSVILTGGSSRTPMIQAAVKAAVGEDKIALNVNADEAAVLGAALHGASLSRQFKTKNIKVSDIFAHDIQASYFAAASSPEVKPRSITSTIFPAGAKTASKKTMTFKRQEDFAIFLDYKNEPAPGFPRRILEAQLTGVTDAIQNLTRDGATNIAVKATISLSESGFVSVKDAVAFGEIKDESIAGKLKGFFGGGSSSSSEEETASEEPARDTETSSTTASSSSANESSPSADANSSSAKKEKEKPPPKPKDSYSLKIDVQFTAKAPMSADEKQSARSRLRAIDAEEAKKAKKEEARNTFESYLYRLRDLLDEENRDTPFKKCSQESERKLLAEKLDEAFEWMHEKGDFAETSELLDHRNKLESYEAPIIHRYKEIEAFPQALNNSQMWNWSTRLFITEALQNLTAEEEAGLPSKWTKEELDSLEKTLKDHESWLNIWVEKQKSVKMNEDPVIETTEMKARAKVLEQHLQKLVRRKVPKASPKKKEKEPKPSETATVETEGEIPTMKIEVEPDQQQVPLQASGQDEGKRVDDEL